MKELQINNIPELSFDVTEALNQFRVNLGFCGDNVKTVMITSSVPNEGKSFVALNLWKMMSEVGIKTLLIDGDYRNSEMKSKYDFYTADKFVGGVHYLAGKADINDVIYKTNVINGYIIPSAGNVVNPTMLLENKKFSDMILEAGRVFDFVIIDTPPLGSVADALNIATHCDGSVLIVRSGATPRKLVKNSVQLLQRTQTPLLGVVLNRIDMNSSSSGYYNRYYSGGYYYYYGGGKSKGKKEKGKK